MLLVTGGGGSGKTRLGREACVQMLMAGWDAGLADDQRRDGAATDRLHGRRCWWSMTPTCAPG